jgi:hypothetical protein
LSALQTGQEEPSLSQAQAYVTQLRREKAQLTESTTTTTAPATTTTLAPAGGATTLPNP